MDALSNAIARVLGRQDQLDKRLTRIESALSLQPNPPPQPAAPPAVISSPPELPPEPVAPTPAPATPPEPPKAPPPSLETNIGLTLVNRIGVVTLVLGVAFFFKWAIDTQWIGPAGRVIIGVIAGLMALGIADSIWQRGQKIFAQGITAVGLGILYLAFYAAFALYHLIPQALAFLLLFVTTLLAVALAVRYQAQAIAMLGFLGGYLSPTLLSTGEDHPWFLFCYILLLNAGALAVARTQKWKPVEVMSAAATVTLYASWLSEQFNPEKRVVATFFVPIYYAIYSEALVRPLFLAAQVLATWAIVIVWPNHPPVYFSLTLALALSGLVIAAHKRSGATLSVTFGSFWVFYAFWVGNFHHPRPVLSIFLGLTCGFLLFVAWNPWWLSFKREGARTEDLSVLGMNGAVYFSASYYLLDPTYHAWMGLFAVAIAAVHLALAVQLWTVRAGASPDLRPIHLSLGVAVAALTLAAPIQFTAYRITMAWALEFLAITWIGVRARSTFIENAGVLIAALVWIRLATIDSLVYPDAQSYPLIWNSRFLTFCIAAACSWLCSYWSRPRSSGLVQYIAGHVIMLWGLTLETVGWAARTTDRANILSVETVSITILFAIYAVILVSIGVAARSVVNRVAGLALMGVVILKLYVFDVWQIDRIYRISAFVALGVLLLTTSFLYSHFRALVERWWKGEQTPS